MKFNIPYKELQKAESSVFSQGGQDGVLEAIFEQIGIEYNLCLEFGARDGYELSNTAFHQERWVSARITLDSNPLSPHVNKCLVTVDNVNEIIPKGLDLLSVDVDGNDYWIWKELNYNPRVVCIEYNSKFRNDESYAIEYNPEHKWEGDDYYGASLLAFKKLGEQKGYTLVYVVDRFDAVFVRNDLISSDYAVPTLDELLPEPIIAHDKKSEKQWVKL